MRFDRCGLSVALLALGLPAGAQASEQAGTAGSLPLLAHEDCNGNGVVDSADIAAGLSADCDGNGVPDECEVLSELGLDAILRRVVAGHGAVTAEIPFLDPLETGGGATNIQSSVLAGNQFVVQGPSGYLYPLPYTDSRLRSVPVMGAGSSYFTAKVPGLFVLAADGLDIAELGVGGTVKNGGTGRVEVVELETSVRGAAYRIFLRRDFAAPIPSVNTLFLVRSDPTPRQIWSSVPQQLTHVVTELEGVDRLYYLLFTTSSPSGPARVSDADALRIAEAFLELVEPPHRDCDGNGVPDSCDLAAGTSPDCNGNGVPDSCDPDCDGNGIPDDCDLALGSSPDCDGDGVLDACEDGIPVRAHILSPDAPPLSAFVRIPAAPPASGDVLFHLSARGGFGPGFVGLDLNGTSIASAFGSGPSCVDASTTVALSPSAFNALVLGGSADVEVESFSAKCGASGRWLKLVVEYPTEAGRDCNGNGVLDACDIASGTSADLDFDGQPDECASGDVRLRLIVRKTPVGLDSSPLLPQPRTSIRNGARFVVELWASDRGPLNTGLAGVYASLYFDRERVRPLRVDHRPPFSLLPDGTEEVPGVLSDLGGSDATSACAGVEPDWARVAVVHFESTGECGEAEFFVLPSPAEVAACGRGAIDPGQVSYGTAVARIGAACPYDLDRSGCVDANDLALFLSCLPSQPGDPSFDPACDFDCSGAVDAADLGFLSPVVGSCCEDIDESQYPPCRRCPDVHPDPLRRLGARATASTSSAAGGGSGR